MDPNQENQSVQSVSPPPSVSQPIAPVMPSSTSGPSKLLLLLVMLLGVVLIALGAYYYMRMTESTGSADTGPLPTLAAPPSKSVSPTSEPELETQSDLESVDVGSAESDLQDIQVDLEAL